MTGKQVRAQYTQEFKMEAVRQVRAGQAQSVVANVLSIPKASLGNWVRLAGKGELAPGVADTQALKVTPEQMSIPVEFSPLWPVEFSPPLVCG